MIDLTVVGRVWSRGFLRLWGRSLLLLVAAPIGAQTVGCFERLHREQPKDAEYSFDLRFDMASAGGSFSCDLDVRASDARKAIEDLRYGVLYQSMPHLHRAIRFPLNISVFESLDVRAVARTVEVRDERALLEFIKTRFDGPTLTLIACANLRNVTIVKGRRDGFMIAAGTVWFQREPNYRRPRVTTINLGPVPEKSLVDSCMVK